jgi:hypothetical protein
LQSLSEEITPPSSPDSDKGDLKRARTPSFLRTHLMNDVGGAADKYKIHNLIMKRDTAALKKKLSKKKIADQLQSLNENQQTPLHLAVQIGDVLSVEMIIQAYLHLGDKIDIYMKDNNGQTVLHTAAESGNERILLALLQYPEIQVNVKNADGNTPLHSFCQKYSSPSSVNQVSLC